MMLYPHKTPFWVRSVFPAIRWKFPKGDQKIYLTFDDGPCPGVTETVLQILAAYGAKATFFCIGKNVKRYPQLFQDIQTQGHRIGNHTNNHPNGWKTDHKLYLQDVEAASYLIRSSLFRPPYGRLTKKQYYSLQQQYQIVCWDVLSGDFDPALKAQDCWAAVKKSSEDGSIIVFHDSVKASEKVKWVLPRLLDHYSALGYSFACIA